MPPTFREAASKVGAFAEDLGDAIEDEVEAETEDIAAEMRRRLVRDGSVASATLVTALYGEVGEPTYHASRQITAPEYWKYVEYGTGVSGEGRYDAPSPRPPVQPILRWLARKDIEPRSDDIDSTVELAEAIATEIGERGTESHPFVRPTYVGRGDARGYADAVEAAMSDAKRRNF